MADTEVTMEDIKKKLEEQEGIEEEKKKQSQDGFVILSGGKFEILGNDYKKEFGETTFFFKDKELLKKASRKSEEELKNDIFSEYSNSNYSSISGEKSAFAGFAVKRTDDNKHSTTLLNLTSNIEIMAVGLSETDAPRIQIAKDMFLELRFKENGELDLENSNFLTSTGAQQKMLFDSKSNSEAFVTHNPKEIEEKLKGLKSIVVNGIDIKSELLELCSERGDLEHEETNRSSFGGLEIGGDGKNPTDLGSPKSRSRESGCGIIM